MVLSDSDPQKWEYKPQTAAKHRVLGRYMKAWLSILGQSARRRGLDSRVVIVDAFAGKGRYTGGEDGSPLIFREIAGMVIQDGRVDEVELFLIESDRRNCEALKAELEAHPQTLGVIVRPPALAEFARAGRRVLELLDEDPRPTFWFIDPFGFGGVPIHLIHDILARPQAEAFITFMVRDVNRFLDQPNHSLAIGELLGLDGEQLDRAVSEVMASPKREYRLRELYIERLKAGAGARYVWPFRVASEGAQDTVYYLIHASGHPKALCEMKDATYEESDGTFAFLGREDFTQTGQLSLFSFDADIPELKARLGEVFAGRTIAYEDFLNEAYPDPRFDMFVERHFRRSLNEMADEGTVEKIPVTSKTARGLRGQDKLRFPRLS